MLRSLREKQGVRETHEDRERDRARRSHAGAAGRQAG